MHLRVSSVLWWGPLAIALAGCGALRPLGTPAPAGGDTGTFPTPAECTGTLVTTFADADDDGFGDTTTARDTCGVPPGRVEVDGDCDDADPAALPGGLEICDERDNDCDTLIDDRDDSLDPSSLLDWYMDGDGDGYGAGAPSRRCAADVAHPVGDGTDCNDANPAIHPGALEVCGGGDEDCDQLVDDKDPDVDPAGLSTYYTDGDADGLGDPNTAAEACDPAFNQVDNADDCDDTKKSVGLPVDYWSDADGDGYGNGVSLGKLCPPGGAGTILPGGSVDCDDGNGGVHPGAVEVCGDGIDNDCSAGDKKCVPVGSFTPFDGPAWTTDPPVYSCVGTCALLFGGLAKDYDCSTSSAFVDNQAYVSGFGDATYCTNPVAETFVQEDAANPGYKCGSVGCSYSAWVQDNCPATVINYCWLH